MTHGTIEETYEYRIRNVVKHMIMDFHIKPAEKIESGEELEKFLRTYKLHFADAILYDIETWMGFDDLLKQVKE